MRSADAFFAQIKNIDTGNQFYFLDVNIASVKDVEDAIGRAELIIFDISVILGIGFGAIRSRDYYIVAGKSSLFYADVWRAVSRSVKPVFLLAFTADLHVENFGLERTIYLDIIQRVNAICWPYHTFPFNPDIDTVKYGSTFLTENQTSGKKVYEIWNEIVQTIPINISLPHCLSATEMRKKPSAKRWDFTVPGASYITRKIAFESGKKAQLKMPDYRLLYRWLVNAPYQCYSRVTTKSMSTKMHQRISSDLFSYLISRSKVSFSCGSELKYFVRKFLEIPAEYTAMVAIPTNDFKNYGFVDGVHYMATEPAEAGEKAKYLIKNKEVAEKLVQNAWNLVAEKHSTAIRVEQVLSCIDFFQQGKLSGASFNNGNFEIY